MVKINPYSNLKTAKKAISVLEARRDGKGSERLVGSDGHFNAGSKKELMQTIAALAQQVAGGDIESISRTAGAEDRKATVAANRTALVSAYHDETSNAWKELGAGIGATVTEVADREGFMRRLFYKGEATQGSIIRTRIKSRYTIAVMAASPSQMVRRFIKEKYIMPDEFYIKANVRVEERELAQGPGDLLEEKLFECQEAIMVTEDKVWKQLADAAVGLSNPLQYLAGGLTPSGLALMQNQIARWGLSPQNMIIGANVLPNITGGDQFSRYFDPLSKYEIVMTGTIGTLLGLSITTDAFRIPEQKVTQPDEIYVLGAPETLGVFTDRGPVSSKEAADSDADGIPSRGWFFWEIMSMVLHNSRSISKAIQI